MHTSDSALFQYLFSLRLLHYSIKRFKKIWKYLVVTSLPIFDLGDLGNLHLGIEIE